MKFNKEALFFVGISALAFIFVFGLLALNNSQTNKVIEAKGEIPEDSFVLGAEDAKITLVEFGDFQCPACKGVEPILKQLMKEYQGKVKFVFRHFPLPFHKNALLASQAAEAAGEQGKFWEYHDLLYEEQGSWSEAKNSQNLFESYARKLNLDVDKFKQALEGKKFLEKVQRDKAEGESLGLRGTPTFFLNGKQVVGGYSLESFKKQIDDLLSNQ